MKNEEEERKQLRHESTTRRQRGEKVSGFFYNDVSVQKSFLFADFCSQKKVTFERRVYGLDGWLACVANT